MVDVPSEFAAEFQQLRTKVEAQAAEVKRLTTENEQLSERNRVLESTSREAEAAGIRQGVRKALEVFAGFFPSS